MKTKAYKMLLCVMLIIAACKKDFKNKKNESDFTVDDQMKVTVIDSNYLPLTVKTIAGNPAAPGYADGSGNQARFNGPWGIDLMDDGSLYVAEYYNHKIRKITPPNIVSTVNIPQSSDGVPLRHPIIVKVAKDGTINIIALEDENIFNYKVLIVKPNGQVITPKLHSSEHFYQDLAKDPYNNFYWMCGVETDRVHTKGGPKAIVEKFLLDANGVIGTDTYTPPKESLTGPSDKEHPTVTDIFCGYNGVKYLVVGNKHIYKLTPSGQLTLLFPNVQFTSIHSIVVTKDSRTMYIADGGTIKSYFNGKLQYLVGPHLPYDGGDGVGTSADVAAEHMALSKDESTIYFTDYANDTVRKLLLR
ncbi:hypothetical protein EOD41_09630 [Mucilaginibacter limnophilus]|uniref:6-bladed beta-propeller n=1 Tax=Mucilaginibacter limnophilus TaxID=1932778 RepID=A0A3S2V846_9SPHI|nr:hypothetical protein [Mucilaginibacter limnophilus]RVU00887.1 hypothetical protein EOD41_09630 [Mucilaginibacter limnophilus]